MSSYSCDFIVRFWPGRLHLAPLVVHVCHGQSAPDRPICTRLSNIFCLKEPRSERARLILAMTNVHDHWDIKIVRLGNKQVPQISQSCRCYWCQTLRRWLPCPLRQSLSSGVSVSRGSPQTLDVLPCLPVWRVLPPSVLFPDYWDTSGCNLSEDSTGTPNLLIGFPFQSENNV